MTEVRSKGGRPRKDESPRPQVSYRLKAKLYDRLREEAEISGFSISEETERRIEASFDRQDAAGGRESAKLVRMLENAVFAVSAVTGREWNSDEDARAMTAAAIKEVCDILLSERRLPLGLFGMPEDLARARYNDYAGRRTALVVGRAAIDKEARALQSNAAEPPTTIRERLVQALLSPEISKAGKTGDP